MSFSTRVMENSDWSHCPHFDIAEFKDPSKMGYEFMIWLEQVRVRANVPMTVTSSYRGENYNVIVGGAKDSAHVDIPCNAVDIGMRPRPEDPNWNYSRWQIITAAMALGCKRIGSYTNGSIHLDRTEMIRPAPRMWRAVAGT